MDIKITEAIAKKVLETVDCGLVKGVGIPKPGSMCVEAAVCYAMGLPHGDEPTCVSSALRSLKIRLNDSGWSSNAARAKGLRRLAVAQLGSKDHLNDKQFAKNVATLVIKTCVANALRTAAGLAKPEHSAKLLKVAKKCAAKGTREAALEGNAAAADAAAYAAAYAAADAAAYAAYAATDAADAADAAANAADAATYATYAAYAATNATNAAAARDEILATFAEDVVQILIKMKAPGCKWLYLTKDN